MTKTTLLAALAVTVLGLVLFSVRKQHYTAEVTGGVMINVVVAVADLNEGHAVLPSEIGVVSRPARYVEQRHVTDADVMRIIGVSTRHDIHPGQVLTWDDLAIDHRQEKESPSLSVPDGRRAVAVSSEAHSVGDLLSPGDHVDVFYTARRGGDHIEMTVLLVQNVAVMTDDVIRVSSNGNSYWQRSVTFSADPVQAELLKHANSVGSLEFAVRHPEDVRIIQEPMIATARDLVEPAQREERSRRRQPRADPPRIVREE